MRKALITIILLALLSCLTACSQAENIDIYPRSGLTADGTKIKIDEDYTLKDYSKEYTEDGCVVTIRYELLKEGAE